MCSTPNGSLSAFCLCFALLLSRLHIVRGASIDDEYWLWYESNILMNTDLNEKYSPWDWVNVDFPKVFEEWKSLDPLDSRAIFPHQFVINAVAESEESQSDQLLSSTTSAPIAYHWTPMPMVPCPDHPDLQPLEAYSTECDAEVCKILVNRDVPLRFVFDNPKTNVTKMKLSMSGKVFSTQHDLSQLPGTVLSDPCETISCPLRNNQRIDYIQLVNLPNVASLVTFIFSQIETRVTLLDQNRELIMCFEVMSKPYAKHSS